MLSSGKPYIIFLIFYRKKLTTLILSMMLITKFIIIKYTDKLQNLKVFNKLFFGRSSRSELLSEKAILKIFEKVPGVHLQWNASYSLMGRKFAETALDH